MVLYIDHYNKLKYAERRFFKFTFDTVLLLFHVFCHSIMRKQQKLFNITS